MPAVTGAFPYNIDNLLGGAVRVLYAPTSQAIPANIGDVIKMVGPNYAPETGWLELGATKEAFSYSRGFDVEGWEIQQTAGNVIEEITDITRSVSVSIAEFTKELLKIIEGDTGVISALAAVPGATDSGTSAQDKITFGSFSSLTQYRIAFIARRAKASGLVTEAGNGGATRGRFVMGVGYRAQLSADEIEMEQDKGVLTAANTGFTFFPEGGQAQGSEYGAWFLENTGTIATS
jgi:hypothetical protein